VLFSVFSFLNLPGALAVSQSYIDAVKLDMQEFETQTWTQSPDSEWFPSREESGADRSDSLESFSAFLEGRFPSSYFLFTKLSKDNQRLVWQNYIDTGNLGGVRSDIYSLWKQARRNRIK
jgi:hypothetical protein